jgi:deoxyribodipyrimidine photo-lyase
MNPSLPLKDNAQAIVWFRHDLRLHDHAPLRLASRAERLLAVYCLPPHWLALGPAGVPRIGVHRLAYLGQALGALDTSLRALGNELMVVLAEPVQALGDISRALGEAPIFVHAHPGWEEREAIAKLQASGVTVQAVHGGGLFDPDDLPFALEPFPVPFTRFRKLIETAQWPSVAPLAAPTALPPSAELPADFYAQAREQVAALLHSHSASAQQCSTATRSALPYTEPAWQGSETAGLAHLARYFSSGLVADYKATRNGLLGSDYSSKWSPWLAVGSLSVREIEVQRLAYEMRLGANDGSYWLWFELLWREYFQLLMWRYGRRCFSRSGIQNQLSHSSAKARHNPAAFAAWCQGNTGCDWVDAAMRELAASGYMGNRMRQNVASYLIHDLALDWRLGAAWFEHQLIDFDVASNQGNWLYLAGAGTDPRSDRRFSPSRQAAMYDPDGAYQRYWLSERHHSDQEHMR